MPPRLISCTAGAVLLLALAGCAGEPDVPAPDRAQAAIRSLGGGPGNVFKQQVLSKDLGTGSYSSQTVFVVAMKGGDLRIVDSRGDVFDDFDDFLRRNTSLEINPG